MRKEIKLKKRSERTLMECYIGMGTHDCCNKPYTPENFKGNGNNNGGKNGK